MSALFLLGGLLAIQPDGQIATLCLTIRDLASQRPADTDQPAGAAGSGCSGSGD